MRVLLLSVLLFLLAPALARADGDPVISREILAYSPAQTITIPYEFAAIDYESVETPELPTIDLVSVPFINTLGSTALTVVDLFDKFRILGIFLVIMLGVTAIFWLYSFVTDRPGSVTLRVTEGLETVGGFYGAATNRQIRMEEGYIAAGEEALYAEGNDANVVDNLAELGRARGRITNYRGQQASVNRSIGQLRRGVSLFKRAKRDANPFR